MTGVSRRAAAAPSSSTVRLADIAAVLRRSGIDVVDFSAGRAAEHTPDYIVAAAIEALRDGDTHQTPAAGTPAYRAACAAKLRRENAIEADPDAEIVATLGCKQGLTLALLATIDPGDEVIVEDPGFVSYAPTIELLGGIPVPVPLRTENGFRWDPADLAAAITGRTRAILMCSPNNPTGAVHTLDDLAPIARLALDHDLIVISDEIYERVTWQGHRHIGIATLPGMATRTVTLMGLTKSFSMGGWRIGFAYAPPPITEAMVRLQQHLMTCAGSFVQAGATIALSASPRPEIVALWQDWERRCAHVTAALDRMPGVRCAMPEGGFYAWADVGAFGIPTIDLSELLLRDHGVVTVPGASFGAAGEGYLRMTCVRRWAELDRGLDRLDAAFAGLAGAGR